MSEKWLDWAKRMQAIAQSGLTFSKDVFDQERYQELSELSVEILHEYTDVNTDKITELFTNETGYPTPKVDVRAAIFKNDQLLLVKEKSDDAWALPGGFCEIGSSASENVKKEVKEESGLMVEPSRLLAVLDKNKHDHPPDPYHFYKMFIYCDIVGGDTQAGIETKNVQFFSEDNLPSLSLKRNTESQVKMMFDFVKNPTKPTLFD
ncbi:NUDIX hydrolase [Paraliobacillus salinarum]|uniref:NUDIX hydrolase n=1 Tax=Paraliobacillus salinarum TaxID=1158996 RepID=UPI0015F501E1|nr:NUDIX hydrolase [Paraliobacillus salinarum]